MDIFNENHTILQMGRCSFDIHVQEILGTLMVGGTVVMLHPRGNIDFDYLSVTLTEVSDQLFNNLHLSCVLT